MNITKTEVFCTLQLEGTHDWANCPFEEVAYLRDTHRHMFHIKATMVVTHDDRDVEFIMLKHAIEEYLIKKYFNSTTYLLEFKSMSCEMIASELINEFNLVRCEVSEDNESGAIVYAEVA